MTRPSTQDPPTVTLPPLVHPPRTARFAVALSFFMNGVLIATWVSRIPAIQARLSLSPAHLGLALLCLALGALIAMPITGWCASRFGSDRATQIAAIICCGLLPSLALAPSLPVLMVALFAFGAVHGGFDVAMNAQAVAVEERYQRPIMSSFHALCSLGALVGAAIGGLITAAGMVPLAHFTTIALLFGAPCCLVALPRLLRVSPPMKVQVPSPIGQRPRFAGLPSSNLLALGTIAFCVMIGEGAMADWTAIFLRDVGGAPESLATAGYAAFSIAMASGRFFGDRLTMRLGRTALLRLSGATAALGLSAALIFPNPAIALVGFAAVGLGFATVVPIVFSAAGENSSGQPGPALAITTTIGYFGFLVGPPVIGFIAELLSLRSALSIIVATSLLIAMLAHHARARRRGEQQGVSSGNAGDSSRWAVEPCSR